ncbi:hypothetical protein [Vulcanisaeta distributa]|uniref:hypothetical protein n=1 Tax=Vulcanisaeta distributa TaxID=164451 RepID=UPI0006CFEE6A|nr:hypothetical protein [Vulcanisaeta distributa]
MSLDEAKVRILEFRDFLVNVDRANAMADALPSIAIDALLAVALLLGITIFYEFTYVLLYSTLMTTNMVIAVIYFLLLVYVIYVFATRIYRKIQNAGKDAMDKYAH